VTDKVNGIMPTGSMIVNAVANAVATKVGVTRPGSADRSRRPPAP
jgi:hypothetical protein